jgi:hypothetical protein
MQQQQQQTQPHYSTACIFSWNTEQQHTGFGCLQLPGWTVMRVLNQSIVLYALCSVHCSPPLQRPTRFTCPAYPICPTCYMSHMSHTFLLCTHSHTFSFSTHSHTFLFSTHSHTFLFPTHSHKYLMFTCRVDLGHAHSLTTPGAADCRAAGLPHTAWPPA